jgi:cobalt-zinc-cadmium resistance protein CzcA
VVSRVGASAEDDLPSSNQVQLFVGLKAGPEVPAAPGRDRPRSQAELIDAINLELSAKVPGVGWLTTTKSPEKLALIFPGAPAEHMLKVLGPDLDELERLAGPVEGILRSIPGIESVVTYRSLGQPHLEFRIDPDKCRRWGVTRADVSLVLQTALGGKPISQLIEGDKSSDIVVRWPKRLRNSEIAILDLPLDVANNRLDVGDPKQAAPRLRLRDLVSPVGKDGEPDPKGEFMRPGAAAIYREDGRRLLPVGFSVRGRPLAEARAEATKQLAPLLKAPYRIEWSD